MSSSNDSKFEKFEKVYDKLWTNIHKVFVIVLELTYYVWMYFIERYFSHILLNLQSFSFANEMQIKFWTKNTNVIVSEVNKGCLTSKNNDFDYELNNI